MSLGVNALPQGRFERHLIARKHQKQGRKRAMLLALNLTAMVDMFSLLVIFLLQTFSTSPEMLVMAKDVVLPQASTGSEIQDAPVLSLSGDQVYLDQKPVGRTQELLRDPAPLMERLAKLREGWQKAHPGQKFPGEINLQAHRELPSVTVSQFMAMLPSQAYGSIQLVVMAGG